MPPRAAGKQRCRYLQVLLAAATVAVAVPAVVVNSSTLGAAARPGTKAAPSSGKAAPSAQAATVLTGAPGRAGKASLDAPIRHDPAAALAAAAPRHAAAGPAEAARLAPEAGRAREAVGLAGGALQAGPAQAGVVQAGPVQAGAPASLRVELGETKAELNRTRAAVSALSAEVHLLRTGARRRMRTPDPPPSKASAPGAPGL